MPSYVTNWVRLPKLEDWKPFLNAKNDDGTDAKEPWFDFNTLIPMPDNVKATFGDGGMDPDWYTWSIEHWGTKWNAYGDVNENDFSYYHEHTPWRHFKTTWSVPMPIVKALLDKHPGLNWWYADEDIGRDYGLIRDGLWYCEPLGRFTPLANYAALTINQDGPDSIAGWLEPAILNGLTIVQAVKEPTKLNT